MNIYSIQRTGSPGYDMAAGFVVIAETAKAARKAVSVKPHRGDETAEVWLLPEHSTCTRIGTAVSGARPRIVLRDFRAG